MTSHTTPHSHTSPGAASGSASGAAPCAAPAGREAGAPPGRLLLSALGPDRPGIVNEISKWIFDRQGNIEDSRMALLGGHFAVLMLINAGPESLKRLESEAEEFSRRSGLMLVLRGAAADSWVPGASPKTPAPQPALRYQLTATALDHPGIVYRISHLLHAHGANIVRAETFSRPAPFTGTPTFRLEMEVDVPASQPLARLRGELERLGEAQNMDIEFQAATWE